MTTPNRTVCDIFFDSVRRYRKPDHLRVKREGTWRDISSDEYLCAVSELSMGLRELGLAAGDRVAILSENRPEWAYADLAVLAAGAVDVPIYTTLTPAQILYILNDAGVVAAVVSNAVQAEKIAAVRSQARTLSHVIAMDPEGTRDTLAFEDIRQRGRQALSRTPDAVDTRAAEVRPENLATIIYTSGTTGDPKGVMLTHDNLVQNTEASRDVVADMAGNDSCLSFLPLCHVFERLAGHYLMLEHGCTVAYAESIDHVAANLLEVRPSVLLAVPRFYERCGDACWRKPRRRRLFASAFSGGQKASAALHWNGGCAAARRPACWD